MAFTEGEKATVIFYLGWPAKVLVATSQVFNSVVNDRLLGVPVDSEGRVRKILKALKALDERLECAADRLSASQVDDITLNKDEIGALKGERLRYIRELSDLLDITIMRSGAGINVGVMI